MKRQIAAMILGLGVCATAQAGLWTFTSGGVVYDDNPIGFTDAHVISGENSSISSVVFTLTVSGGYDSDLAGYLRLGNTAGSPDYAISLGSLMDGGNGSHTYSYTLDASSPSFYNLNPNDTWTLFLADQSPGGQDSVVSWSLDITAVPEMENEALALFGVVVISVIAVRRRNTLRLKKRPEPRTF
jgi:hypothetical protein